jgi:hypothetical protein
VDSTGNILRCVLRKIDLSEGKILRPAGQRSGARSNLLEPLDSSSSLLKSFQLSVNSLRTDQPSPVFSEWRDKDREVGGGKSKDLNAYSGG